MATLPIKNPTTVTSSWGMDPAVTGYRICIDVTAEGQISVGTEDLPEMPEEMEPSSSGQPVADIKEGLTLALEMYRSQEDAAGMDAGGNAFDAGFAGTPTTPTTPTRGARA